MYEVVYSNKKNRTFKGYANVFSSRGSKALQYQKLSYILNELSRQKICFALKAPKNGLKPQKYQKKQLNIFTPFLCHKKYTLFSKLRIKKKDNLQKTKRFFLLLFIL